jgi:hypothetical protein
MALDPVIYMQVEMTNLYISKYNLSLDEFLELDEKYDLLEFIGEGYEPFHLMGNEGILNEIHDYLQMAQKTKQPC